MARRMILILVVSFMFIQHSFTSCINNPCGFDDYFQPPSYNCFELSQGLGTVICTCPDGKANVNAPCRVCDSIDCGPTGLCLERIVFPGLYYACGCSNGTENYVSPLPCPGTVSTTTTMTTTTTTTTSITQTPCFNGGVYDSATGICRCLSGYIGTFCESYTGQPLCRNIVCANGGVCNTVPTANSGIAAQCWCLLGYGGSNCELLGTPFRCSSNLCQNGGTCEESRVGNSVFAYCHCPVGYTDRLCEKRYFSCTTSGLFADWVNCPFGRYFQCLNNVAIALSCPKGFHFNPLTNQCDWNYSCQ